VVKKILKKSALAAALLHLVFMLATSASIVYLKYNNPEKSSLMLYREMFRGEKKSSLRFMELGSIPPDIVKMIIATEDYRFHEHPGIDIDAIKRAYFINKKAGYFMYGGSTITQQLARTMFLCPKKLLVRKYLEVIIAFELELILSKERILELYVNYAEWGNGVYGISAAAWHYYTRECDRLSPDEASRLIAILAGPCTTTPATIGSRKFILNRYNTIKFRYYTYLKFNDLGR